MAHTNDFVICTVSSDSSAKCTDHSGIKGWVGGRIKVATVNRTNHMNAKLWPRHSIYSVFVRRNHSRVSKLVLYWGYWSVGLGLSP